MCGIIRHIKLQILLWPSFSELAVMGHQALLTSSLFAEGDCFTESENILNWKGHTRTFEVQLLALHRTAPRVTSCAWEHFYSASWIQAGLMVWPLSEHLWVNNLFLISNLNFSWHSFRPFPWHLSLCRRDQCCPSASPCEGCWRSPLRLLFSRLCR